MKNLEYEDAPLSVRLISRAPCQRKTVQGWKSCGGYWRKGRAFDILTDAKGERLIEVKFRKEVYLVPWESVENSK